MRIHLLSNFGHETRQHWHWSVLIKSGMNAVGVCFMNGLGDLDDCGPIYWPCRCQQISGDEKYFNVPPTMSVIQS